MKGPRAAVVRSLEAALAWARTKADETGKTVYVALDTHRLTYKRPKGSFVLVLPGGDTRLTYKRPKEIKV